MIYLPLDDRYKIDLAKPVFTLDVNQIAIRHPNDRPASYETLVAIEYNYFETQYLEAAVTPQTFFEITAGVHYASLGWPAYQRMAKSRWFKERPAGSTLNLNEKYSNELWLDMRHRLWPTVTDLYLTPNQQADVNQLFFHTISSGATASNSVFVTQDHNFLTHADEMYGCFGIQIMPTNVAWETYQARYNLVWPGVGQIEQMWRQQADLMEQIRAVIE